MKKVLVIEDWDKFVWKITQYKRQLLEQELLKHELKDVVEFETFVKEFYGQRLGIDLVELSKKEFKSGEKVLVFVVKPEEKNEKTKKA